MASTYLSNTPSSAGDRRTFTISTWFKISDIDTWSAIISAGSSGNDHTELTFNAGAANDPDIEFKHYNGSSFDIQLATNRVFRDVNAWYHIVIKVDTTQATASDRVKMYINGVEETSFAASTYPSLNFQTNFNNTNIHTIGRGTQSGTASTRVYWDGSLTHFHLTDGTAYDASAFGETDSTTGIWKPKTAPSVSYGSNGFFLKFENSSSMGTDSSGNANNFTVNGTLTQTEDTPSNVFATGNPLIDFSGTQVNYVNATNGNTTITANSTMPTTLMVSTNTTNKWYYEYKVTALSTSSNATSHGWSTEKNIRMGSNTWAASNTLWLYATDGDVFNGTWAGAGTAPTYTTGDIIGCLVDLNANEIKWYKNGTLAYTFSSVTFDGDLIFPCLQCVTAGSTVSANFGNGIFGTTAVSSANSDPNGLGIFEYNTNGGYALCTKNINAQEYS